MYCFKNITFNNFYDKRYCSRNKFALNWIVVYGSNFDSILIFEIKSFDDSYFFLNQNDDQE